MFVEFVGSSGAGKTALCQRVRSLLLRAAVSVARPADVLFGPLVGQYIEVSRWSNILVETFGWPWTLAGRRRFRSSNTLVRHRIDEISISFQERVRLARSWRRKVAIICSCRRASSSGRVVLHDEGMVQLATVLFGRDPTWCPNDLDAYLDTVPMPDWVVGLETPLAEVAVRLAARPVQPVPDRDQAHRRRFLQRGVEILRHVRRHERVARRWISVDNSRHDLTELDRVAELVARRIIELVGAGKPQFGLPQSGVAAERRVATLRSMTPLV